MLTPEELNRITLRVIRDLAGVSDDNWVPEVQRVCALHVPTEHVDAVANLLLTKPTAALRATLMEENNTTAPSNHDPRAILSDAIKAVPATKYALGAAGFAAAAAIVLGIFWGSGRLAFFGTLIALAMAAVVLVFAKASKSRLPAGLIATFMWGTMVLFMAALGCTFSSVFFGSPLDLRGWVTGSQAASK